MPSRMKTWTTGAAAAFALITVTACGGSEPSGDEAATSSPDDAAVTSAGPEAAAPELPEADLAGIPDVVAVVNGTEITGEEFTEVYQSQFQQAALQSQTTGQEVDQDTLKSETAEGLVSNELLVQEADARELEASPEEVDATLEELATGNGLPSSEEFLALLEEQGTPEEEVRAQLGTQVRVDKLVAEEAPTVEPTDEELQALYDSLAGESGAESGLPPLEEVRPQLEEELRAQAEAEAVTALLEELRADADVTVNL